MRNYFYAYILFSLILPTNIHTNGTFISIGVSDLISKTICSPDVFNKYVSFGVNRFDRNNISSGLGISSFFDLADQADNPSVYNSNLIGVSFFSFFSAPVFLTRNNDIRFGAKSNFDLSLGDSNFIIGPTISFAFKKKSYEIKIEHHMGCLDFDIKEYAKCFELNFNY